MVLLRATTHMTLYERALEERGIPTHVVGGRGYWSQQQVGDLRNWLAALANPRDELSLLSVLASPLVGVSLDGVALLALRADRAGRDPWWALQDPPEGLFEGMPDGDERRLRGFARTFAEERAAAPRVSLERLIDRAVTRTGYDKHVLARPAGDRRMANVRKLMRMAREFEADEGRDLRRFIDFVAERDLIQSREGEAPLEAEELQRVRLMTIHRAKGLEFPVVFVADLGKEGREENGPLQISRDGRVGLRLASLGADAVRSETLDAVKAQQNEDDEQEERRIMYVALTRAREHLVLSGATDLEKRKEPEALTEPLRWMWRHLVPGLPADGARGVGVESYDGRDVPVRWERLDPGTLDELLPPSDRMPTRPEPEPEPAGETPSLELGMMAAPRALPVARLSYSSLESYRRCGYRFYLERALRLPSSDTAVPEAEPLDALAPLLRGNLVHQLLERLDMRRGPLPTQRDVEALIEQHGEPVREADVADLRDMVERFWDSELRGRLAAARRVRAELPFCFTLEPAHAGGRSLLVNGFVDVYALEDDRTLIVDYKSDRLEPDARPAEMAERDYATQRLVYALAALREGAGAGGGGAPVPRAPRRAGLGHLGGRRRRPSSSAACSSSRAAWWTAASCPATSPTWSSARAVRASRRSARGRPSARSRRRVGPAPEGYIKGMSHRDKPPFRADHVGSLLRPEHLLEARADGTPPPTSCAPSRTRPSATSSACRRRSACSRRPTASSAAPPGTWTSSTSSTASTRPTRSSRSRCATRTARSSSRPPR